ncbi:hypothetical protein C8R43DRAFT_1089383 [Mycena crocata]|nr:hypothetical protein C8R43DRAFT_1089383 [Mycena crocata]
MVLWIVNSLSPQTIRERIMDPCGTFTKRLIRYLENSHQGEFFRGTKDEVQTHLKDDDKVYKSPTQMLPRPPPKLCSVNNCNGKCVDCVRLNRWLEMYRDEVDSILVRSNIHRCLTGTGVCRARFPRDVFESTKISEDGHIDMRHLEPMMNTVNSTLTYLVRSNSDVTSMLSGTAVKAVVSYVSDYISKMSLKSFQMFASVYQVKNGDW